MEQNIRKNVENIIFDGDVKKLNYVKLNGIQWGCVQQQQRKIEHLETSVYELQEAMKKIIKTKPKAKTKSKPKMYTMGNKPGSVDNGCIEKMRKKYLKKNVLVG